MAAVKSYYLPTSTLWLSLGVDGLGVPAKEMCTLYFLVYKYIHIVYYIYRFQQETNNCATNDCAPLL